MGCSYLISLLMFEINHLKRDSCSRENYGTGSLADTLIFSYLLLVVKFSYNQPNHENSSLSCYSFLFGCVVAFDCRPKFPHLTFICTSLDLFTCGYR